MTKTANPTRLIVNDPLGKKYYEKRGSLGLVKIGDKIPFDGRLRVVTDVSKIHQDDDGRPSRIITMDKTHRINGLAPQFDNRVYFALRAGF